MHNPVCTINTGILLSNASYLCRLLWCLMFGAPVADILKGETNETKRQHCVQTSNNISFWHSFIPRTKIQFLRLTAAVVLQSCCSAEDTAVQEVSGSRYTGSNTYMLQCPGLFGLVRAAKKLHFSKPGERLIQVNEILIWKCWEFHLFTVNVDGVYSWKSSVFPE